MSATKVQANWTTVSFNSVVITRVTSATFGQGGTLTEFSGDLDIFPTVIANLMNNPHASITTADIGTIFGFSPGLTATLTATTPDALKVSGQGVIFTMINSVFENADAQGQHAQFGSVSPTWKAFSSDGSTPPLSIARG